MSTQRNSVAILVDGAFFLKRYTPIFGKPSSPSEVANNIYTVALKHVHQDDYLYRIFYYDCHPLSKKIHHPLTKEVKDFSQSTQFKFRTALFDELKKKRKVALRLGKVKDSGNWIIRPQKVKELLFNGSNASPITKDDIHYDIIQKGVDIRIGVDISSLTLKKQINKIILISGDEDFIPAAKLARREGIDFVLDPMWNKISDELFEHIDGLQSTCPNPGNKKNGNRN